MLTDTPARDLVVREGRVAAVAVESGDIDVDDYLSRRSALLGDRPNGTEFNPGGPPEAPEAPRAVRPEDDSQA